MFIMVALSIALLLFGLWYQLTAQTDEDEFGATVVCIVLGFLLAGAWLLYGLGLLVKATF